MTALALAALALAVGYVASGVTRYRAERRADVAMETYGPWFALVRVGRCTFVQVMPYRLVQTVEFPTDPYLPEWEYRFYERVAAAARAVLRRRRT